VRADDHLRGVTRVFGPEAWEVYDLLDRSLDPRGPDSMVALATERLTASSVLLDVGCRDASHLVQLVRATGASGVGIDPLERFVEWARATVSEAGLAERIRIVQAPMQEIPSPDDAFDVVWCRDAIEIVADLQRALSEVARVLRPGGQLILYTVLATDRLEAQELALLGQSLAVVPANLVEANVREAFGRAGLDVVLEDPVGTEWREWAEERTQPVSRDLLRLARLRRSRDRIVEEADEDILRHVEANLHWLVFQFLGKLLPTVYVLQKPA
jgi:ubiquinone/menaquinone biosynthesis C-methylase UbiE